MKQVILVGSIGSLKAASIMLGCKQALIDAGYSIKGYVGVSGSSIVTPLLSHDISTRAIIDSICAIDEDSLADDDIKQQGVDWIRTWIPFIKKRKGDKPFTGLYRGNGVKRALTKLYKDHNIKDLSGGIVPAAIIATKLASEAEQSVGLNNARHIFTSGDPITAVRSSTAIPVVFRPEFIKGIGVLADGGIVDAIPVDAALNMMISSGPCDIVIADATNDIYENKFHYTEEQGIPIKSVFDVAVSSVYQAVRENTVSKIQIAEKFLADKGCKIIRIKPNNVKIRMFETGKFEKAYDDARTFARKELAQ